MVTDITPTPENESQAESQIEQDSISAEPAAKSVKSEAIEKLQSQIEQDNAVVEPVAVPSKNNDVIVMPKTTLNYIVIAVTFFLLGVGLGSIYMGNSSSADIDEEELGRIVRNLLVEAELLHPQIDDMYSLVDDDPYLGDEDAPIVMVEFSAYACPFCGRHFSTTLLPILEDYGEYIRYVYRDHPIINQNISFPASIAANCAFQQDTFWEYHRILFENQNLLGPSFFIQTAEDLELDMDAFRECYQAEETANEVINDFNDATALNITGTPSFYINGRFHSGAQPYEYFETIILEELSKLNIDPTGRG